MAVLSIDNWRVALPLCVCTAVVLQGAAKIFYNVFLHPLSSIPGPSLSKISDIPFTSSTVLKGNRAQTLLDLHKRHGPLVRIGPNEVSVSDPEAYRSIYASRASTKETKFYSTGHFRQHHNVFSMSDKSQHAARRKLMNAVFSQQKLLENLDFITARCTVMVDRIKEEAKRDNRVGSASADIFELLELFSVEVICQFTFGFQFLDDGTRQDLAFLKGMDNSAARLGLNQVFPWLDWTGIGVRLPGAAGVSYRGFAMWESINRHLLERYLAMRNQAMTKPDPRLFAAPLRDSVDGFLGRKLTQAEIEEEIMSFTFAGSGTTSHTIVYLVYALTRPEGQQYQGKLRQELLQHPDDYNTVKNLPYVNAVIKETLRLYPTIISTLPRVLDSDQTISGKMLPKGTVVGMQNYVHHRDPAVFPEPHAFRPERWLAQNSKAAEATLTPFSLGEHNCIGQNLARIELYLAVSHIFRALRLTLSKSMTEVDMEMEDRFAIVPRGRKLVVEVEVL